MERTPQQQRDAGEEGGMHGRLPKVIGESRRVSTRGTGGEQQASQLRGAVGQAQNRVPPPLVAVAFEAKTSISIVDKVEKYKWGARGLDSSILEGNALCLGQLDVSESVP